MADDEITLLVDGVRYGGFKSGRVTLSIESLAGSFAVDVTDRWGGQEEPRPIVEEDPVRVEVNGVTVIDGYVDRPRLSAVGSARTLSYSGRDRAAALVDCDAVLDKWTYYNVDVREFAAKVAAPFGVTVSVQDGLELPKVKKLVISPGDTAYEAIRRAAGDDGVLIVSDGAGGIVLTRSSSRRANALIEGVNILTGDFEIDAASRFRRYVIMTQTAGTDTASGNATRVRAEATDEGVRRTNRVKLIRVEKGYSVADARRRADWEARIRAARAETVNITVKGWTQRDGSLWRTNTITRVQAPRMLRVDGDMLISQVDYSISEGGTTAHLRLVRPDAFDPEPKAVVRSSAKAGKYAGWKELEKGAL